MKRDGQQSLRIGQPGCSGRAGARVGVVLSLLLGVLAAWGQEYYSQNWHLDEGLPDGDIAAIEQTPDGFLWIGTPKGLARFDGLQFKVFVPENTPAFTDRRISSRLPTGREPSG